MAVKGKSAKGVIVDFDLLKIKEQMATSPASVDVQKRQDFVENRMRRRGRKKVPQELFDKANALVEVDKELPSVEGESSAMIDEVIETEVVEDNKKPASKSKQKARPKSKKKPDGK